MNIQSWRFDQILTWQEYTWFRQHNCHFICLVGITFGAFKYTGIDMTSQLNIRNTIFEMDSMIMVNMVTSGSSQNSLLHEVISLIHRPIWRTSVCQVHCEAKQCVDLLTNLIHSSLYFNYIYVCNVFRSTLKLLPEDDVRCNSLSHLIS